MLHATIKKVTEDTENMSFNTAIARMMEFTNFFTRAQTRPIGAMKTFLVLLAPYAPHLCEELWHRLGETDSISKAAWPAWDESALVESVIEIPLQINGKLRSKMKIAVDAGKDAMLEQAKADATIAEQIAGKTIIKEIVVPGRLVNLVVK
jgi:leucyl-tRNA synthetase